MKVRIVLDCEGPEGPIAPGTVIEHPDCHRLVELGVAEPIDDEAIAARDAYLAQQKKRSEAQKQLQKQLRRAQEARAEKLRQVRLASFAETLGVEPEAEAPTEPAPEPKRKK